ncbi:hypothetical protein Glove_189g2 [Diversispora epigaea]|uniref:Restriction endonuclease type IV Mrr domain-containing protein n=1 Tax=Diversispora epigaea TaxID=1348612 RepID=A0A397ILE1_9GLOM|nr:hypothetical protein Glove_189g2 [Diversispora epigaea]
MTKFQQEENSPVQKGKNFEMKIEKLLTDANIKCEITGGPGDKEIDIKGMKKGVKFIIECKNWRTKNIVDNRGTIGIVAAPSMNRYTPGAKETARTSIYNVILVDRYITQIYYFYYCPTISAPLVSPPVVSPSSRVVSGVSGDSKSRGETAEEKQAEEKQAKKKQAEKKQAEEKQAEKKQAEENQAEEKEHDLQRFFSFLDFFPPPPILRIPLRLYVPLLTLHLQALIAVYFEVSAKKYKNHL